MQFPCHFFTYTPANSLLVNVKHKVTEKRKIESISTKAENDRNSICFATLSPTLSLSVFQLKLLNWLVMVNAQGNYVPPTDLWHINGEDLEQRFKHQMDKDRWVSPVWHKTFITAEGLRQLITWWHTHMPSWLAVDRANTPAKSGPVFPVILSKSEWYFLLRSFSFLVSLQISYMFVLNLPSCLWKKGRPFAENLKEHKVLTRWAAAFEF